MSTTDDDKTMLLLRRPKKHVVVEDMGIVNTSDQTDYGIYENNLYVRELLDKNTPGFGYRHHQSQWILVGKVVAEFDEISIRL